MVEIYAIRIDDPIEDDLYNQLLLCVSDEKREQIKKFHFIEDAKRTFYGDLMIRHLACSKFKLDNNELVFRCNNFGKPSLQDYPNFHYNISHSGVWVVCAMNNKEIGIDIEQIKPVDFDIAKRFFSYTEYQNMMTQPEELRSEYFFDLWTLKESYIKCVGKGLSIPLNSFNIYLNENTISISPVGLVPVYLFKIFFDREYKLSVCSEEDATSLKIRLTNINQIKEELLHGASKKNY